MIDFSKCSKEEMADALEYFAHVALRTRWPYRISFTEEEVYEVLREECLPVSRIQEEEE